MIDITELLSYIPPDDYDDWIKVGMALKHEGADLSVWESWSMGSNKFQSGDCAKRWKSFDSDEITGGTLYHLATKYGYNPPSGMDNDFDLTNLLLDDYHVDPSFVSREKIPQVTGQYDARGEMLEYFTTLFEPDDFVGYCIRFRQDKDGRYKPTDTQYRRTAGDIISKLRSSSIEMALGTLDQNAGAYVRFNPLDGKGENNSNVIRRKYCLLESDTIPLEQQYALIKAMNLPCVFVISSGGKSLHAIVKVDAENEAQYKERVRDIYDFAEKSGFKPDGQDKNESRFSRLPGVKRGDRWQYIVARSIGAPSYQAWIEWRQEQADDLPTETNMAEVWDNLPPLKEELIPGILRAGHKLLLAGPSKAGKSFLLMNLAVSFAEGIEWIGIPCKQGRVCYVNLELDEASCFDRFREIYKKLGIPPRNISNITVWNLRGHSVPMNKLAPVMIRRFKSKGYIAIIVDPIYKVITGDENSATEMSEFCSYFDKVATEVGVAMIYCHHHSKGAAGKYANAADRSSGSGVFARDPDAILDLREVRADGFDSGYRKEFPEACSVLSGYEISSTLREFAPMQPFRVWFDHPVHRRDSNNYLGAAPYADSSDSGRGVAGDQKGKTDWFETVQELLECAQVSGDTAVTLEAVGISEQNAKKKFSKESNYEVATIGSEKLVHLREDDTIIYKGETWHRYSRGNSFIWGK